MSDVAGVARAVAEELRAWAAAERDQRFPDEPERRWLFAEDCAARLEQEVALAKLEAEGG